jgi:hypothetical protein
MLSVVIRAASSAPWFCLASSAAKTPRKIRGKIFGKFFESRLWRQGCNHDTRPAASFDNDTREINSLDGAFISTSERADTEKIGRVRPLFPAHIPERPRLILSDANIVQLRQNCMIPQLVFQSCEAVFALPMLQPGHGSQTGKF